MALIYVDISSYNSFRSDALGRASQDLGFDVDGYYGYQCWDLAAELWMNMPEFVGQGLYPHTGPNLSAEECWTYSRYINAGDSFDLIYNFSDVKRGDCIVISSSPISSTGHIAFADEDYNGSIMMDLLGQNQEYPNFYSGHIPTVTRLDVGSYFLGAFRNKSWIGGPGPGPEPPTPPHPPFPASTFHHFPWVLIGQKRRMGN